MESSIDARVDETLPLFKLKDLKRSGPRKASEESSNKKGLFRENMFTSTVIKTKSLFI